MIDLGNFIERVANERRIADGATHEFQTGLIADGCKILKAAGRFIVDDQHLVAAGQQRFGQIGSDETCAAGNQNICHASSASYQTGVVPSFSGTSDTTRPRFVSAMSILPSRASLPTACITTLRF